jgi:hypothetical protein
MGIVSRFVENAVNILDAAEQALESGHTPGDFTILISAEGAIRMIADSDWPLDSLQAHHGSRLAYRVSERNAKVRVEGRAGSRTCVFETERPERAARLLLSGGLAVQMAFDGDRGVFPGNRGAGFYMANPPVVELP